MKSKIERKLNYAVKGWDGDYYIELTTKPSCDVSDNIDDVYSSLQKAKKRAKQLTRNSKMRSEDRSYRIWKLNVLTAEELADDFMDEIDVDVNDIVRNTRGVGRVSK